MNHYPNIISSSQSFYIKVDKWHEHQKRFVSGDVVRGTVAVDPSQRPQRILISLVGREKFAVTRSSGTASTRYSQKVKLFERSLEVFSSLSHEQNFDIVRVGVPNGDKREIPFSFTFPHVVEKQPPGWVGEGARNKFQPLRGFHDSKGFLLPPSYVYRDQIVEYYLEACLHTTSRRVAQHTVRQMLPFYPANPILPEDAARLIKSEKLYNCRTHRLYPDYDPHEGFLSRTKHRWHKHDASTPYAMFKLGVTVPQTCALAGVIAAITIDFQNAGRSEIVLDPPHVCLTQISVRLVSQLNVRVPYTSLFSGDPNLRDSYTQKTTLLHIWSLDQPVPLNDGMKLADLAGSTQKCAERLPPAPTFSSYGQNLKHRIEIKLWVECAGEKFEIYACNSAIELRSGIQGPEAERIQTVPTLEEFIEETRDGVDPPPYEPPPYQPVPAE